MVQVPVEHHSPMTTSRFQVALLGGEGKSRRPGWGSLLSEVVVGSSILVHSLEVGELSTMAIGSPQGGTQTQQGMPQVARSFFPSDCENFQPASWKK